MHPTSRAPSFRTTLWRATRVKLFLLLCAAAWMGSTAVGGALAADRQVAKPEVPSYSFADQLATQHHCWRGSSDRPAGAIPSRSVVEVDARRGPELKPADVGFAIWLGPDGKVGSGDERPGTVYAFCP